MAASVASRIFGLLLAAGGAVMLIATAGLLRQTGWSVALALVGSVIANVIGLAFLVARLESVDGSGVALVTWAAVVVVALYGIAISVRSGVAGLSGVLRRIQVAAVVGLVFAVGQFWYTNSYAPSAKPPHLDLVTMLEKRGEKGGLLAIEARVQVSNTSDTKIRVVDSLYYVVGQQVSKRRGLTDVRWTKILARPAGSAYVPAVRHTTETGGELLRAGHLLERGWSFEPDENYATRFLVFVPSGAYDLIRIYADIRLAKATNFEVSEQPLITPGKPKTDEYGFTTVSGAWALRETSWVRRLTRGEKVLHSKWILPNGEWVSPDLWVFIAEKDQVVDLYDRADVERVEANNAEFGILSTFSTSEVSLFPATGG